ncbi:hypothetical protein GF319_11225 [Candidatus Bathyarchaeota archaeon]|nr:hypothetical protein [Candidatus Bathyarchaeota archaeon]
MDDPSIFGLDQEQIDVTRKVASLAIMTAVAVSTNYLLIGVVNIKLMDLIVFTGGYLYGPSFGSGLGILIWLVYGTLNPYGFSFPTLVATSLSETIYGIFGNIYRKYLEGENGFSSSLKLGILGFLLTFIYDLVTNILTAFVIGIPIFTVLITGIPFAIMHQVSNAIFFAVGFPPLIQALRINRVVEEIE